MERNSFKETFSFALFHVVLDPKTDDVHIRDQGGDLVATLKRDDLFDHEGNRFED